MIYLLPMHSSSIPSIMVSNDFSTANCIYSWVMTWIKCLLINFWLDVSAENHGRIMCYHRIWRCLGRFWSNKKSKIWNCILLSRNVFSQWILRILICIVTECHLEFEVCKLSNLAGNLSFAWLQRKYRNFFSYFTKLYFQVLSNYKWRLMWLAVEE